MEAGNRCFDDRVPEEVNRRIIDHSSDVLLPYTERSRDNLLREGIATNRIYVTGNPIREVLDYYAEKIDNSGIEKKLNLHPNAYFLVTLHRAENVDIPERLEQFVTALQRLADHYQVPVICSVHPRTRSQLEKQGKRLEGNGVRAIEPLGLFDFVHLEKNARCVLSDSGTVQEECSLFGVPNVTLRDVTERPETVDVGSNCIAGSNPDTIFRCVATVLQEMPAWTPPLEYQVKNVSGAIARIVLGHRN
jgi:UDP-N-acetylglucosamine 2-epimerase (non-hydrolysing)